MRRQPSVCCLEEKENEKGVAKKEWHLPDFLEQHISCEVNSCKILKGDRVNVSLI